MMEYLKQSDGDYSDDFNKFQYSYLDQRITNETFSKVFEMASDKDNFYVFSHNN